MNINYGEIITKANERKDALKALSEALKDAQSQATKLHEALNYFAGLLSLMQAIDPEGRNMLGAVNSAVLQAAAHAENYKREAFGDLGVSRRITWLCHCLEEAA
jgi:hypothetical protein